MRSDVARVLAAERLKLRRRAAAWIVPAAAAGLAALVSFAVAYAAGRDWIGLPSGFYLAAATGAYMVNAAGLAAVLVACFAVAGEFALGTAGPAWMSGIGRGGWFAGRLISASAAVAALFLFAVIVSVAAAGLRFGFGGLYEKDFLVHPAARLWRGLGLATALTLLVLVAVTAACGCLAALFNRPAAAIAVCMGAAIVLNVLSVFEALRPFLITSCLTRPFEQMVAVSKGLPPPDDWTTLAWQSAACAGAWGAAGFVAGRAVIARKEITF